MTEKEVKYLSSLLGIDVWTLRGIERKVQDFGLPDLLEALRGLVAIAILMPSPKDNPQFKGQCEALAAYIRRIKLECN